MKVMIVDSASKETHNSSVTINCKDGSKRVVNVIGRYSPELAHRLGVDLEGNNFLSASVSVK